VIPALLKVTAIVSVVETVYELGKKIYNEVDEYFTEEVPEKQATPVKETAIESKKRKTPDTSKFTQYQYDFIVEAFLDMKRHNAEYPNDKKNTQDLADILNTHLKTNKHKTTFAKVWNHKIDRDTLAKGSPIEIREAE
jgi:hypothetical protein